jgi:hypothetical protein
MLNWIYNNQFLSYVTKIISIISALYLFAGRKRIFLGGKNSMNKAILSVFTLLMLVLPICSISAYEGSSHLFQTNSCNPFFGRLDVPSQSWLEGSDQTQISTVGVGFSLFDMYAQEFRPSRETLTAVALWLFNHYSPKGTTITVSIRDNLRGTDLTTKSIKVTSFNIKGSGSWVLFDFDDINVIPGEQYYILCVADKGYINRTYNWFFDIDDKYSRGVGWLFNESEDKWIELANPWNSTFFKNYDFCFITYYQEPKYKANINPFNMLIYWLIEWLPFLESFIQY